MPLYLNGQKQIGTGVNQWSALIDTPASLIGQAGNYPRVNALETALEFAGAIPGVTDHGALTGLVDDDHLQYLKEKASGGTAAETPVHTHQAAAEAGTLDHGAALTGLADDDHVQYLNIARGDARYYTETELDAGQLDNRYFTEAEHINASAGVADAGKPVILDAAGNIDATMVNDADIDHGSIGGLADDDHGQYLNIARGDARFYTEVELDAGQLDNRYYTEAELDGGQLDNRYYTEAELGAGQLDTRYYTQAQHDSTARHPLETVIPHDIFTALLDTPSSYSSQAGKYPRVNVGENALEFVTGVGAVPRTVTKFIAASDAIDDTGADAICSGVDDDVDWNAMIGGVL